MPDPQPQLHPRQVRLDVTMTNGVKNALVFTLHRGDYSFVEDVQIEGVEISYTTIPDERAARRKNCVTQESGHKVPASTIRKIDGRLVGSCAKCYERINIARFPGTAACAEATTLLQSILFDKHALAGTYLPGVAKLEKRLTEDLDAVTRALGDVRQAKAILLGRIGAES